MKVLLINSVCGIGSTGRICTDIAKKYEAQGHEVKIAYGREQVPKNVRKYAVRIGTDIGVYIHGLRSRLLDQHGRGSVKATKRFLKWVDDYTPDLLWLHNLHGYYINYELLFEWIKKHPELEVKWTLHDCWAFTGHCSYFTMAKCYKWMTYCAECVQKKSYPTSLLMDNSASNFERKRKAFAGIRNMMLITPSRWLAGLVEKSFLKEYPVEVHYNEIDRTVFKPTQSNFREETGIGQKKMILGVASVWDDRKGFRDFMKLRKMLDDRYVIVLVGLSEKQLRTLPEGIIGIRRTNSPLELAAIYTAADVFFNPTYEDNYPTVILEAEACGTKVITYDTGGCREGLKRADSAAVKVGDLQRVVEEIMAI